DRFLSIFLAVAVVTDYAYSMSLLDRHLTKLQNPSDPSTHLNEMKFSVHHNFAGGSDAIVGPRPFSHVGSFRGKPIISRQKNTFVDDNGVGVLLLPYNYNSWRIHTRPIRR
ncbi:hypothetical protein V3C99_013065, partial [Haemonchus contortus]